MIVLGLFVGHLFGWSHMDCIFLGGMLAMSSTTIIYKAFDDLGLRQQQFTSLVMSVLILEDILAIVMMVMLSAIAGGNGGGGQMLGSLIKIAFFIILWFVVGIFAIPLFLRSVKKLMTPETLLIVSLGLCFLMAVISTKVGFSSAFGAFVMGSILAETVEAERIIKLVEPVKNLFGAIFFVSVGMLVDPQILVDYALPIAVLVLTIILGQAIFGSLGYFLSGQTLKSAMRCGFSMAQIGEFSFIIATLGLSLGVISNFLYPVIVAVSVITTFLTPYMIRAAIPCYNMLEKILPQRWINGLNHMTMGRGIKSEDGNWKKLISALLKVTVIYGTLCVAIIIIMTMFFLPFAKEIMHPQWARYLTAALTILFMSPFMRAMIMKKNHSDEVKALYNDNKLNLLPIIFLVLARVAIAASLIFYVCIMLTPFSAALMLSIVFVIVILIVLSKTLKKRSIMMERMFIQNLRSRDIEAQVRTKRRPLYEGRLLDRNIHTTEIEIPENSKWIGNTLMQLNLGKKYGIHVSSIIRGGRRLNIPSGQDMIFPYDKLQVIGNDEELSKFDEAVRENVYDETNINDNEMHLRSIILSGNSPFVGKKLMESGIRDKYGCMVVGLEEGKKKLSTVSPNYVFKKGDVIWVVGEDESLKKIDV